MCFFRKGKRTTERSIYIFVMFCPLCGNQISENHKFCYKCGNPSPVDTGCSSRAVPKPQSSASVDKLSEGTKSEGTSSTPTFETFQATKRKERASNFRPKGNTVKRKKSGDDNSGEVAINFGIMFFDGNQLKPQRSANLSVKVPKVSTKDELLAAGLAKHKAHSKNLIKDNIKYVLLYPDGSLVIDKLRESDEGFVLYKYKNEYGKAYQRINFYICPSRDYNEHTMNTLGDLWAESGESDKEAVNSDAEIADLTCKTKQIRKTSSAVTTADNLSASLTVSNPVTTSFGVAVEQSAACLPITATPDNLSASLNVSTNPENTALEVTTISHHGSTLSTVSNTSDENIDSLYESITEMFPHCSPSHARNALLATNNNLEAAVNLIVSNQTQSTTTTQEIYASFEFCNDITNDPDFTDNCNVLYSSLHAVPNQLTLLQ